MKNAELILAQYETKGIKTFLREAPALIKGAKEDARVAYDAWQSAERMVALAEADLMTDISAELDPGTGKAAFTNDKTRAAELIRRKSTDKAFIEADRQARAARHDHDQAKDALDELIDKYRSYRIVAELTSSEIRLLAAQDTTELSATVRDSAEEGY